MSTSVFGAYSHYYNLLYKDKDYQGEADYVRALLARHAPSANSLLDLGCGTGRHDLLLAAHGHTVTGADLSEEMLSVARTQPLPGSAVPAAKLPEFVHGDVRTLRLGKHFDAVVSLFHVMSYQVTNQDLRAAFTTARAHLHPGGVFLFDCWYGPGVLTDPPATRVKRLQDDQVRVTRLAEPVLHPQRNVVDVNYHIFVQSQQGSELSELKETHHMRYLFQPEIELLLEATGFRLQAAHEFATFETPTLRSWTAVFVARAE